MGLWGTPYVPSPGRRTSPISIRTTEYEIDRYGLFGSADFTLGFNEISVGGWWEHNEFNQARRFYAYASRTEPGFNFRAIRRPRSSPSGSSISPPRRCNIS
jgi:iron complex outermembrane receptor protein